MFVGKEEYMKLSEFWVSIKVRKSDGLFYDLEGYECSNFGKVRKLQSDGTYKEIYSREITSDDKDGYRKVNIVAKYSGRVLSLRLDDIVMSSIFPQFYKPVYKVYHVDNDINNCSIYNLYLGRPSDGKKPKESVALPYGLPYEPDDDDIITTASNYSDAADFEEEFHDLFCWACCKDLMRKIKYRQVSVEADDIDNDNEIESGFEPVVEDELDEFEDGSEHELERECRPRPNTSEIDKMLAIMNGTSSTPTRPNPDLNGDLMGPTRPNSDPNGNPMGPEEEPVENEPVTSDSNPDPNGDLMDPTTDPNPDQLGTDPELDLLDHTSVEIDPKHDGVKFELKITAHDAESLWKALGDLVVSIRDGQLPDRRSSSIHKDDSGCRYRFDGEKLIVNVVPSTLTNEEMIDIASHYSSRKVFRRLQYTLYTYCVRRGIASKLKFKDEL